MRRMLVSTVIICALTIAGVAQQPASAPAFEVASVRPIGPIDPGGWGRRPPFARSSGQFDASDKLRSLIIWAFAVDGNLIEGNLPILDDGFLIAAKAPGPVLLAPHGEVGPMNLMMQSLLAERFKLQVRWETRSFPVYALRRTTTERLGRNLKRIDATCPDGYPETVNAAPDGCAVRLSLRKEQSKRTQIIEGMVPRLSDFARFLSAWAGRRVVDDTALVGRFELTTAFQDSEPRAYLRPLPEEDFSSLRDALRDDLGFKLESARRDFPVLIVEHVEQPTEN